MDVVGNTPAALAIPFAVDSQPVVPDVGSVSYTIRDHSGTPLAGLIDIPYLTQADSYQMQILIPSSAHMISISRRFERRSVVVSFKIDGGEAQIVRSYRVIPEPLHTVSPKDVRSFIGIEEHELPDADIDLFSAFMAVEKDVGMDTLHAALVSGTTDELAGNTLVRMQAVLDVLPSAKQRMAQTEKRGVKEFSRVDLKELDKLKIAAEDRYQEAYDEIVVAVETNVSVFLISTNTDAITG